MEYEIKLYEVRGRKIVDNFITGLNEKTIIKIFWLFDKLREYGPSIGMPYVKRVKTNLSEIRIKKEESVRLFFTIKGKTIYILHGFKKKKNKIPAKELEIAKNRLTKYNI